jgi:dTMP kinase
VAPDLLVLLDVSDVVAEARRASETDKLEAEGAAFHAQVRAAYRDLASPNGWVTVDANAPLDVVAGAVRDAVVPLLAG